MTPRDRDDRHDDLESEHGLYDDSPPRSIFAATWFRVVLILIVLGVIGAVAVPYILDAVNPPPKPPVLAHPATPSAPAIPPPAPPPPPDKPADADKSAVTPAPAPPLPTAPPGVTPSARKSTTAKTAAATTSAADKAPSVTKDGGAQLPAVKRGTALGVARTTTTTPATTGSWWVQVGAFKDAATAKRLADKLRADNYTVEELAFTPDGGAAPDKAPSVSSGSDTSSTMDQYDVLVSGMPADQINKRLTAKGLTSRQSGAGVTVTPSLPLRDAVALSKALAVEGLKVQVKRAGRAEAGKETAPTSPHGGMTLYRVRVAGFPDRGAAQAAAKELAVKGYKPFVGRG